MGIQLSNNIKIFVTYNTDFNGIVKNTGFTTTNTKQLIIQKDSLQLQQTVSNSYLADTFLDSSNNLDSLGTNTLDIGSVSFKTLLNSSSQGIFDAVLWNGLVSDASYPSNLWNSTTEYLQLTPVRDTKKVGAFGILIFSDDYVYVLDACRVASNSVSLALNDFVGCTWDCRLEHVRVVTGAELQDTGSSFNILGTLEGSADKITHEYKLAAANLVKVGVAKAGGNTLGYIASTGIDLNFQNSLEYIDNNWVDRTTINKIFTGAGDYSVQGNLSFYAKSPTSYAGILTTELNSVINSADINPLYKITIEILSNGNNLCTIVLDSCNLSIAQQIDQVISNTITFKLVNTNFSTNCSIKFYT